MLQRTFNSQYAEWRGDDNTVQNEVNVKDWK